MFWVHGWAPGFAPEGGPWTPGKPVCLSLTRVASIPRGHRFVVSVSMHVGASSLWTPAAGGRVALRGRRAEHGGRLLDCALETRGVIQAAQGRRARSSGIDYFSSGVREAPVEGYGREVHWTPGSDAPTWFRIRTGDGAYGKLSFVRPPGNVPVETRGPTTADGVGVLNVVPGKRLVGSSSEVYPSSRKEFLKWIRNRGSRVR